MSEKLVEIEVGLERWALGWVGGKDTGGDPKSCFNCPFLYVNQKRCSIHGPDIIIDNVMHEGEMWTPVCTYQNGGIPMAVPDYKVVYNATLLGEKKAEQTGLEWAKWPGTNCGGYNDGTPCEHFVETDGIGVDGVCNVMKPDDNEVDWDDCCDAHRGESIPWKLAQKILKAKEPDSAELKKAA